MALTDALTAAHDAHFDMMDDATAQAVCDWEDGDADAVAAFDKVATATQRRHWGEEVALTITKRAAAVRYARDSAPVVTPSCLAARNAAAAIKDGTAAWGKRALAC